MKVECPFCHEEYNVKRKQLGMNAVCSMCQNTFVLYGPNGEVYIPKKKSSKNKMLPIIGGAVLLVAALAGGGVYFFVLKDDAPKHTEKAEETKPLPPLDEKKIAEDIAKGFKFSEDKRTLLEAPKDITEYVIPDGVITIGDNAFSDCKSLYGLTISKDVQTIGKSAFRQVVSIQLAEGNQNFKMDKNGALIDSKNKVLLYVPPSFSGHYEISKDVTRIGDEAFAYCDLTRITIPNGVTSIGKGAFYCCFELKNIRIPKSVAVIEDEALSSADSIQLADGNPNFKIDKDGALIDLKNKTLLFLPDSLVGHYKIPDDVVHIGPKVFYFRWNVSKVTIPESVTSIGYQAFYRCNELQSITIPSSVTHIGEGAFGRIKTIKLAEGNSNFTIDKNGALIDSKNKTLLYVPPSFRGSYQIADGVTRIGTYAFSYCENIQSVTIPNSVRSIGKNAFYYCKNLRSIKIPDGVTTIDQEVFYECAKLSSVTIPESVTSIGNHAFGYCKSLDSITIPESVTSIGYYAFSSCENLSRITIPNGVKIICSSAFRGIGSVQLAGENPNFKIDKDGALISLRTNSLLYLPPSFSGVYEIPNNITSIHGAAFGDCKNLSGVKIPNSVKFIGYAAFAVCSSLTSVTIPNGVTRIDGFTFTGCKNLQSVTIPDSVTRIEKNAFYYCGNLKNIKIPDSVTFIGAEAFKNAGCEAQVKQDYPNLYK